MLKIEKVEVFNFEGALRGARNPKNSWNLSDSDYGYSEDYHKNMYLYGEKDLKLLSTLANTGTDHGKFLRQIMVSMDIVAPLYWWKEFDTYKVGTVANSCSTMHKIHAKEFTLDDFSHEHLLNEKAALDDENPSIEVLENTIKALNEWREKFLYCKDKLYWWQMIQLLPSSYNQKRTWTANYAVLRNIYSARKNHKLDEWHTFCDCIETLPYAKELIIGQE